jgi:serine/threonine-protein kinase RIO1
VDTVSRIKAPAIGNPDELMNSAKGNFLSAVSITSKLEQLHPVDISGKRADVTKSAKLRKKIKHQARETARKLNRQIGDYIESEHFLPDLLERRKKKGIDSFSDAEFSRLTRAKSMGRGKGS